MLVDAPRPDPNAAQRRAADPTASAWVAASAGTGKTKVLTDRVLCLLLSGTPPARILCLTFTKAAAANMATRLADRLAGWAVAADEAIARDVAGLLGDGATVDDAMLRRARRLFAEVLDVPGGMRIQTIHAFCQALLRRFPLEAGVAPHFAVADEATAAELLADSRERALQRARGDADAALAEALATVTARAGEGRFDELLAALVQERGRLLRLRALLGGGEGIVRRLYETLGLDLAETPQSVVEAACRDAALDGEGLRAAVAALETGSDGDRRLAAQLAGWLAADGPGRAARFAAHSAAFLTREGTPRRRLGTKAAEKALPRLRAVLDGEADRLVAVAGRLTVLANACGTAALLRLADAVLDGYERAKEARALLDYDDLVLATRRLLDGPGASDWVLYKLDGGIDHVLIDEAQDTNPDQWAVVERLVSEFFAGEGAREAVRTVFAVGDVKQSIFSFQRADPDAFRRMRRYFAERADAGSHRFEVVDLAVSFRSTAAVLAAVDAVFASAVMRAGVADDEDGTLGQVRHVAHRTGQAGLVELWPLVGPEPLEPAEAWRAPLQPVGARDPHLRLARLIAAKVKGWIDRGEPLESRGRPVRAGDVMVLVRRRGPFTAALVRALKDAEVPVAGIDRMVLTEQLAVMDVLALLRFLLLPEDDLTLATVLKGPLVGLTEDELFALAHGRREPRLWHELGRRADDHLAFRRARDRLAGLLAVADRLPPHELVARALAAAGGRRAILRRLGPEAADPLDELLAQCLAYERAHVPSLQGFLHWLETGAFEVKRDLEHGARDQVRVMTVHGAKGLQAPIVVLPDTCQVPTGQPPVLWPEDEREPPVWSPRVDGDDPHSRALRAIADGKRDRELRRLLYVAMTRAEDRLHVCGWEGARGAAEGCWYKQIAAGLAEVAAPVDFDFTGDCAEGWHGPGLRLVGRQTAAPVADRPVGPGEVAAAAPPAWARRPAPPEPEPSRPLAPSRPTGDEPPVRSPIDADGGARFRRGLVIHRLLQLLPELPAERRAEACRRHLARPALGLAEADQAAWAAEVMAVLGHPELAPLFGPESRAEVPIVGCLRLAGRTVTVSGQIDRLAATPDGVLLVDYKTNRPPPGRVEDVPAVYLDQMASYAGLVRQIWPGRRVRAALLWTDAPSLMELPGALLDGRLER